MEVFDGAIGIDLGTTYSCVAVFLFNNVDVIPNDQGNRTTPSRIAFHNGQMLVGDGAMNLAARGASNVLYDSKRMIGRKFTDAEVQADAKVWPFPIQADANGGIRIVVQHGEESLKLEPEQVSARILVYLKECAQRHLGKIVKRAVITVPAYFNDAQRERTKAAGTIAGLEVLRIINEPTAAALCYGLGIGTAIGPQGTTSAQNVVVFDFGGGTFDVSVITIDGGAFEVRATAGDTHLGGQDLDAAVVMYLVADIKKRFQIDVMESPKILAKLRAASERTKRCLSSTSQEEIALDGLLSGTDYSIVLSRAKFDEINAKTFKRCLEVVERALKDSTISKKDIDEVIMVGGSSRIPKIRELVSAFFGGKTLCTSVNPDEAIAIGAAIQASILSDSPDQVSDKTSGVVLMDVVSLSIGLEVDNGKFDALIPRNTTIPNTASKSFTTFENNQMYVDIEVYEGERPFVKNNHLLGSFVLDGIAPARKGVPSITVTFSVDANGMLTVTAEESGKKGFLVVENKDKLSSNQINDMIKTAQELEADDKQALEICNKIAAAEEELEDVDRRIAEFGSHVPSSIVKAMQKLETGREWLATRARDTPNISQLNTNIGKFYKLTDSVIMQIKSKLLDKRLNCQAKLGRKHKEKEEEEDETASEGGSGEGDEDESSAGSGDDDEDDGSDGDDGSGSDGGKPKKKKHRKEEKEKKPKKEKKEKKPKKEKKEKKHKEDKKEKKTDSEPQSHAGGEADEE